MKRLSWVTLAIAIMMLGAVRSEAQQAVCGTGSRLMQWPTSTDPVWEFCFNRPSLSTAANGSGLELYDVYHNGHLLFKRAHAPILNVTYAPGGCGCYRDWSDQEVVFSANNVIVAGYAEPTTPPITVCDNGGRSGDVGSFTGVAAEKLADRLILTTQLRAGWYRYDMKWMFHLDGRIEGYFGFAAVTASCVSYAHTHHNYWRLDFDIDGSTGDSIETGPPPGTAFEDSIRRPVKIITSEMKTYRENDKTWMVRDGSTGRGYRMLPGKQYDGQSTFAVSDFWFLQYKAAEIDDVGQTGPACAIKFTNFLNNESIDGPDIVMWYRGGAFHQAGHLDDCHVSRFTLEPIGDWTR